MPKRSILIVGLFLLAVGGLQTHAQPALPFYDWEAGPCEYCLYGEWTAVKQTPLFHRMDSRRSSIAFTAKKNEKLTAVTGVVITTQAGLGRALKATVLRRYDKATDTYSDVKIKSNETFHILTYHGEGVYTVWFKRQLLEASLDQREFLTLSKPRFTWWVKIKNNKGQIGWTRQVRNFNGPHEV
jgi:hypothetical protein